MSHRALGHQFAKVLIGTGEVPSQYEGLGPYELHAVLDTQRREHFSGRQETGYETDDEAPERRRQWLAGDEPSGDYMRIKQPWED